jgi:hypothetical protein
MDEYILLGAKDEYLTHLEGHEALVLQNYISEHEPQGVPAGWRPALIRWARLQLPTGQIARSAWKENERTDNKLRRARCVKVNQLIINDCI